MKFFHITLVAFFLIILVTPFISGAHYIVGRVEDAKNGHSANNHTIVLWNPSNGVNDNVTDIIGAEGNSNTNNIYMVDCELLNASCDVGDVLSIRVVPEQAYYSDTINVSVTGAGYDLAENLTLKRGLMIDSVLVDDSILNPFDQIDLVTASEREVTCEGVINDYGESQISNVSSKLYQTSVGQDAVDDNNNHYTNLSCFLNFSYGNENETYYICNFFVQYYANSDNWTCRVFAENNYSVITNDSDETYINPLLSVGVVDVIDYGVVDMLQVSDEIVMNITNYGNVMINLSLLGFGNSSGDGLAMDCDIGNIPLEYEKYNLTGSNPGVLSFSEFNNVYENLTINERIRKFNLKARQDDGTNDAINQTYWRIYVPEPIGGSCAGNISIGARVASADV